MNQSPESIEKKLVPEQESISDALARPDTQVDAVLALIKGITSPQQEVSQSFLGACTETVMERLSHPLSDESGIYIPILLGYINELGSESQKISATRIARENISKNLGSEYHHNDSIQANAAHGGGGHDAGGGHSGVGKAVGVAGAVVLGVGLYGTVLDPLIRDYELSPENPTVTFSLDGDGSWSKPVRMTSEKFKKVKKLGLEVDVEDGRRIRLKFADESTCDSGVPLTPNGPAEGRAGTKLYDVIRVRLLDTGKDCEVTVRVVDKGEK